MTFQEPESTELIYSISFSDNYNYFYVPSIPEWAYHEYDGLFYEGTQYPWEEVDYRLSVDVPSVPEPSTYALLAGFGVLIYTMIKRRK
tara:strand:- start:29 stop:292 length:264 start_codon:yes stop_codon:yes gene_type:complete